jgi:hypothetical protein
MTSAVQATVETTSADSAVRSPKERRQRAAPRAAPPRGARPRPPAPG